jgi:SAM-dependent methyltransferase
VAQVDYSGRMALVYGAGRSLPASVVAAWTDAAAGYVDRDAAGMVCDLGSGTGRFSGALASRLGLPVVAVEPAAGMREQARTQPDAAVSIVAGRAEQIPARASVFALVWMSQAIHHVTDLDACARELDRTLADGGRVILRGMFDVRRRWVLTPFFPGAAAIAESRFPSLRAVVAAFGRAGLGLTSQEEISQTSAASADELVERTRCRADSTLELLPDQEFERGLTRLAGAARRGELAGPIVETLDLVVFAR